MVEPVEIQALRARVAELKNVITNASLVSPADDHVLFVLLSSGRVVDPQTPVMSIGDPAQIEVRGRLTSADTEHLREGMPANIDRNDINFTTSGRVRLLPAPYGSGTDDYTYV